VSHCCCCCCCSHVSGTMCCRESGDWKRRSEDFRRKEWLTDCFLPCGSWCRAKVSSKEAELRIVLRVRTPSLAAAAAVTYVLLALYFDTFLLLSLSRLCLPPRYYLCAREPAFPCLNGFCTRIWGLASDSVNSIRGVRYANA